MAVENEEDFGQTTTKKQYSKTWKQLLSPMCIIISTVPQLLSIGKWNIRVPAIIIYHLQPFLSAEMYPINEQIVSQSAHSSNLWVPRKDHLIIFDHLFRLQMICSTLKHILFVYTYVS